ncbi:MAG: hypothetical protein FJZ57_04355 [Chlamydiae bacterium]|nr:hypothetical protein [Chlamydiota bacterium]
MKKNFLKLLFIGSLSSLHITSEETTTPAPYSADISLGTDYFRGAYNGTWPDTFGILGSFNFGVQIPIYNQGFAAQGGASVGLYDWQGKTATNSSSMETETFLSVGLSRQSPSASGINAGIAYDWMVSRNFGTFCLDVTLEQARAQIGYMIKGKNEIGITTATHTSNWSKKVQFANVKFQGINQVNLYWRALTKNNSETMLWAGVPYGKGLQNSSGKPGYYIAGMSFMAKLTKRLAITGHGVYMGPKNGTRYESITYGANICASLTYTFGGTKRGERPYLSLANNSNFLIDTNKIL